MTTMTAPTVDAAEVNATLATLERDGFCVMKGVIPPSEVGAVRDSVAATVRKHSMLPPPNGVVTGLLRLDQSIAPYVTNPRLMAVIERLFGNFPRVSMLTGMVNDPGIKRGPVHADWPYNQNARAHVRAPYPDVLMNMVTMWMLSDYTPENGGTIVIPGSHKRNHAPKFGTSTDPMSRFEGEVHLQGKAGDVGLFDARTWHATAENITKSGRVGVIVRYCPWWLNLQTLFLGTRDRRQIVDSTNGDDSSVERLPLSIYQTLPESIKPLLNHMVDESA